MKPTFLLLSLCAILMTTSLAAQKKRTQAWKDKNKHGNRYEGTYIQKVGSPAIDLVSLTAGPVEAYTFNQGQQLKVRYFSPVAQDYNLKAEELRVQRFYWMEDIRTQTDAGWQTFEDWPVDFLLRRLAIPHRNLGVLVRLGPELSDQFAPAYVYHTQAVKDVKYYTAQINVGRTVAEGHYTLYKGQSLNSIDQLKQLPISPKNGGDTFPIQIPLNELNEEGWYTVEVNLPARGSRTVHTYSFQLYHKPLL